MRRINNLRAAAVDHPHLAFALLFVVVALPVGFLTADPGDRAGYLIGVAFALAASIVLLFALELEEDRRA